MPFWRLYYHLIWATRNREPILSLAIEGRLFGYLVHKATELGVFVYDVNGDVDHVHLVAAIPSKLSIADVVKHLKRASSHDLNQSGAVEGQFAWQCGYGVFSLGERNLPDARAYVQKQKEHHRHETTNVWLERVAEFDEGPNNRGLIAEPVPAVLHDPPAVYSCEDLPFL